MAVRRDAQLAKAKALRTLGKDKDRTLSRILNLRIMLGAEERQGDLFVSTLLGVARIGGRAGTPDVKEVIEVPVGSSLVVEMALVQEAIQRMCAKFVTATVQEAEEQAAPVEPLPPSEHEESLPEPGTVRCPACNEYMKPVTMTAGRYTGQQKCPVCNKRLPHEEAGSDEPAEGDAK